jgi:hypothetical protein
MNYSRIKDTVQSILKRFEAASVTIYKDANTFNDVTGAVTTVSTSSKALALFLPLTLEEEDTLGEYGVVGKLIVSSRDYPEQILPGQRIVEGSKTYYVYKSVIIDPSHSDPLSQTVYVKR